MGSNINADIPMTSASGRINRNESWSGRIGIKYYLTTKEVSGSSCSVPVLEPSVWPEFGLTLLDPSHARLRVSNRAQAAQDNFQIDTQNLRTLNKLTLYGKPGKWCDWEPENQNHRTTLSEQKSLQVYLIRTFSMIDSH